MKKSFPRLYIEPCNIICDKPTLQLLKCIVTFNTYRGYINRKNTKKRRRLIRKIKPAYRAKTDISQYDRISIF